MRAHPREPHPFVIIAILALVVVVAAIGSMLHR
jgi:hypothetical protein